MEFLPEQIEEYAIAHTTEEPQLLAALNRETWANVMIQLMHTCHMTNHQAHKELAWGIACGSAESGG